MTNEHIKHLFKEMGQHTETSESLMNFLNSLGNQDLCTTLGHLDWLRAHAGYIFKNRAYPSKVLAPPVLMSYSSPGEPTLVGYLMYEDYFHVSFTLHKPSRYVKAGDMIRLGAGIDNVEVYIDEQEEQTSVVSE